MRSVSVLAAVAGAVAFAASHAPLGLRSAP